MKLEKPHKAFKTIAHRGMSKQFPENTQSAFIAALKQNIDFIEIDVHRTLDQQLVVIHDDTIDRTSNGKGSVKDKTLEELMTFNFGKGPQIENILTFEALLKLAKDYNKSILIEIKKPDLYPNIGEQILEIIDSQQFPRQSVIIQSFNQPIIKRLHQLDPNLQLGVLISRRKYFFKTIPYKEIAQYANYVNPDYRIVNEYLIDHAHRHQLKVFPYTVNTVKDAKPLIDYGVDGLISDCLDDLFHL